MTSKDISSNDVLCGRGGLTNSHVGNKRFRCVVAEYQLEYLKARKNDKKNISREIVTRIKENGGRFLQRNTGSRVWSVASEKKAVEKTSQALREGLDVRRKALRPSKLLQKQDSILRMKNTEKIANGVVLDSPMQESLQENIPDLVNDESKPHLFEPIFAFFPETILNADGTISEKEYDNVLQI